MTSTLPRKTDPLLDFSPYELAIHHHYGFRPAFKAQPCPAALSHGSRCRLTHYSECVCTRYQYRDKYPDFLDHPYRWINRAGYTVLTAEPYLPAITQNPDAYEFFLQEMADLGLRVTRGHISPWHSTHGHSDATIYSAPDTSAEERSETQLLIIQPTTLSHANPFRHR